VKLSWAPKKAKWRAARSGSQPRRRLPSRRLRIGWMRCAARHAAACSSAGRCRLAATCTCALSAGLKSGADRGAVWRGPSGGVGRDRSGRLVWSIPATRMKAKREHRLPLSSRGRSPARGEAAPGIGQARVRRVGVSESARQSDHQQRQALGAHPRAGHRGWYRTASDRPSGTGPRSGRIFAGFLGRDGLVRRMRRTAASNLCLVRHKLAVPLFPRTVAFVDAAVVDCAQRIVVTGWTGWNRRGVGSR